MSRYRAGRTRASYARGNLAAVRTCFMMANVRSARCDSRLVGVFNAVRREE